MTHDHAAKTSSWLKTYDFNPLTFANPPKVFGPMARWWWPGNDVTAEELKREINAFADHGFAGVEVQPLSLALPNDGKARGKINSWDTPEYYENLRTVMEEARRRGMIVDVTNGSGWPPGGSFLNLEDGFQSLEYSEVDVSGGIGKQKIGLPLPFTNKTGSKPRLQVLLAAKGQRPNTPTMLDPSTVKILTSLSKNDTVVYAFPSGQWKLIAFWAVFTGEKTNIAASAQQGTVVDHLDSTKVIKLYNHLFGDRTGLIPYFGNPMRAIFNDSYEFKVNRHYSADLIEYFKIKRGYDITPWLPANMKRGYNMVAFMRPNAQPDFSFSKQDWRLRYDYDITVSELLSQHFFQTSKHWMETRGLVHRTQAYGLYMDMIAMAGAASIPETESMLGTETNLKVMTSGGLLYNRPIVSAESIVFSGGAYTTTPQKMKMSIDKLFAAGVNQIIYHGIPYRYFPDEVGPEGWYPFSSPLLGKVSFSSNLGEGNIFWKEEKEINAYVKRVQYALRCGKARADVLIHYPFLSVERIPDNPQEILTNGNLKDVEAALPPLKAKELPDSTKVAWAGKVYPIINQLEAMGITWAWVNDLSLQEANLDLDGKINIRGNRFEALILANDSVLQLATSARIKALANKGMNLLVTGSIPTVQPSYLNWEENDKKTGENIVIALKAKNSCYYKDTQNIGLWVLKLALPLKFSESYPFIRQSSRELTDGSRIQFIWNKTDKWQTISLTIGEKFKGSYWLDGTTGKVIVNKSKLLSYEMPPYGTVLLFCTTVNNSLEIISSDDSVSLKPGRDLLQINDWTIQVDSLTEKNSNLFDWRDKERLKFSSADGIYRSTFTWDRSKYSAPVLLDLGKVAYVAEVILNDQFIGKKIFSPYVFDITKFLQTGHNTIQIRIKPGQLNSFIGNAANGDKRYSQFRGRENQLSAAGLLGPVFLKSFADSQQP